MTSATVSDPRREHSLAVLSRFGELLSGGAEPGVIFRELTRAAVEHLGARAAVAVGIGEDGSARIVASENVPEEIPGFPGEDTDAIGPELGDELLRACIADRPDSPCRDAFPVVVPLTSGGGLFGSVIYVFPKDKVLDDFELAFAHALAGLTASGLNTAARYTELAKGYAELRASREVLERSQKLRALGEMAAGVSHDLKNILNPLALHLQFLQRAIPKDNIDALDSVLEMRRVLQRGLETIERLRDFSRQAPAGRVETTDLNRICHEALEICRPRTRSKHDLHYTLVERFGTPPTVTLQASEAVAAVVNLIVNAIDAMATGGTVTVSTGTTEEGNAFLTVADNGPGMSPEIEHRVFEPFFTTKGQEGTGLGLAMVYAFVQRHRGRIALKTAPGEGAAFTLTFPAEGRPSLF